MGIFASLALEQGMIDQMTTIIKLESSNNIAKIANRAHNCLVCYFTYKHDIQIFVEN